MFPCEDSKTVSVCLSVCPHPEKRYHHSFVNISPTLVIDALMERSSRVLQHGIQKIWLFFWRKFEIEFDLYFDLCWRAEIIQVGLNMHLYVDIGDASSSLWGSTSSFCNNVTMTEWLWMKLNYDCSITKNGRIEHFGTVYKTWPN